MIQRFCILALIPAWLLSGCTRKHASEERILLNEGWKFSQRGSQEWLPARIPGTVHTDLLHAGKIADPFYGCNEKELQWIGETDWTYRLTFVACPDWKQWPMQELVFEGLDTWADVYLNGRKIIEANNMFRAWRADVKDQLLPGQNVIEVRFHSALQKFLADSVALGYPLPGGRWNTSRKAAYHFGWDWGPRFITCGIWKPVYLHFSAEPALKDVWLNNDSITPQQAWLTLHVDFRQNLPSDQKIDIALKDKSSGQILLHQTISPAKGSHNLRLPFQINNPHLWWCNGLGEPHLYHLSLEIKTSKGVTYKREIVHGVRKVELVRQHDEWGESFFFRLNGVPVYSKGANYIPSHSFLPEVKPAQYRRIMQEAVFANMNMLRVWGGGVYEDDYFYDLADSLGLMIWQDFMFACALYPGTENFLNNVRAEAIEQVSRLRRHPSVVLWCGNNESDEAWHNWGYQQLFRMSSEIQDTIWNHYQRLFHTILPEVVKAYSPSVPYVSTSPQTGWGRPESMTAGDSHYWGVWWGREPFEKFQEKVPRFMSEFGFQAMPEVSTLRKIQPLESDSLFSPQLRCHQKHPTGFETIQVYLEREKLHPQTVQEYIYLTQLIQARGIGLGIAAQRSSRPRCMGSLYWQLNDCWPVTSWSSVDFLGNRKALHFTARDLYDTLALALFIEKGFLKVFALNDNPSQKEGQFKLKIRFFGGKERLLTSERVKLNPLSSNVLYQLPATSLPPAGNYLLEATLANQKFTRTTTLIPGVLGELSLERAQIKYRIEPTQGGFFLTLTTDRFVPWLQLYLLETPARFSDNFVNLWPGIPQRIYCETSLDKSTFERQLRFYSLNDYLTKNNKP
ncbi:MAG: glycosyl hydrolase 2 galactose-binding domain-containing protein [Bacteroidales bacterium]